MGRDKLKESTKKVDQNFSVRHSRSRSRNKDDDNTSDRYKHRHHSDNHSSSSSRYKSSTTRKKRRRSYSSSPSSSSSSPKRNKKPKKAIKKHAKSKDRKPSKSKKSKTHRKVRDPSSDSSSSTDSISTDVHSSSDDSRAKKKRVKKDKKKKSKKHKKKKLNKKKKDAETSIGKGKSITNEIKVNDNKPTDALTNQKKEEYDVKSRIDPNQCVPQPENQTRSFAPMTKEMWEKQQSVIRKVYDEDTGRTRLIRGDGEVLEEIVSEERHNEINRNATKGDGASFQASLNVKLKGETAPPTLKSKFTSAVP